MAQTQLVPKLAHLANSMDSTLLLEKIFSYGSCFVLTLALKQEFEQMAYLEEVCDCRLNDGYSTGYRRRMDHNREAFGDEVALAQRFL